MTATPTEAAELASALEQSHDPDWRTRRDAAALLRRFVDVDHVGQRLIEMLSDPGDLAVIEAASAALALDGGNRGLERIAAVFDSLDEQAGAYAAVAVSDALGDTVFDRLLEVITDADDPRVKDGARHLGSQIGMQTSPQWNHAFPG